MYNRLYYLFVVVVDLINVGFTEVVPNYLFIIN